MKKKSLFLVLIALSMLWPQIKLNGQGVWIEQVTNPNIDNHLFDRGEDCLGYTKENSQFIYFFDINAHQWTTADLGSEQLIRDIVAHGKVILAYTNQIVIGYSSITSNFDTLHYLGEPINPEFSDINMRRGYGCTDRAAFFVTDEYFYVFDGVLGSWQSYAYTMPALFQNNAAMFIKGDDYIGVILPEDLTISNNIINMAYSLPHHNFTFTDEGGYIFPAEIIPYPMSHGFVTQNVNLNGEVVVLGGYSTFTNEFSNKTILVEPFGGLPHYTPGIFYTPENITEKTVWGFTYSIDIANTELYTYSTYSGLWHMAQVSTGYSAFAIGGSIAVSNLYYVNSNINNYIVFDSQSGEFHTINSINNDMIGYAPPTCSSDAFMASDSTHIWFHNPSIESSHFQEGFVPNLFWITGDHFIANTTWDLSMNNNDILYIYNSNTDAVTSIDIGFINSIFYPSETPDMFAFAIGPGKSDVYLYSAITDSYTHIPMAPSSFANIHLNNHVAIISSQNGSENYLYNAKTNFTSTVNFPFDFYKLGKNIALFTKDVTAHVYNFETMNYSDKDVSDYMGSFWATGNIGLISNLSKEEFYAYNGFHDNWVGLIPEGNSSSYAVATDKTALVVRNDRIYAFDPEIATDIVEPIDSAEVTGFELFQNHPNPFNNFTTIPYVLTKSGYVSLKIFNLLGNEVAELVDENKSAGDYQLRFNADGLSEGIYYYTMSFNNQMLTKKMMVTK
jgi:hypothetical protein